jgi:hypothetical protein
MKQNLLTYRTQALVILFLAILPVLLVGGFNYIVDPLQIYRKQRFVTPKFWSDQRFQNAGKINSYLPADHYESLIIGDSQVDNFIPSEVERFLNTGKVLKLTIDGSTPREQYLMVEKGLENGKIKTVLWGIGRDFSGKNPFLYNKNRPFPDYLYTKTVLDDHPYLLSLDMLFFSINLLQNKLNWEKDLNKLNYWMPQQVKNYVKFNSEKNLNRFKRRLKRSNSKDLKKVKIQTETFPNVDVNLVPVIKRYPNVDFVLFFTPNYYLKLISPSFYKTWMALQKTILQAVDQFPNVSVFGFDDNPMIGGNAANYRDLWHYHSGVNLYMLESIRDGRHRLTCSNFDLYEKTVKNNLLNFKILSDFEIMIPMAFQKERSMLWTSSALK